MANLTLEIDGVYSGNFPNSVVTLSHPQQGNFLSPLVDEINMGGSANFHQPFAEYADNALKTTQNSAAAVQMLAGKFGNVDVSKYSMYKTIGQTINLFSDSSFSGFQLNMVFVVTSRSNIQRYYDAIKLASSVFPKAALGGGNSKALNYFKMKANGLTTSLTPPSGYKVGSSGSPENTWDVNIGTFFSAHGMLLENAQLNQTRERVGSQGYALVSTVSCSFRPALDITDDEFISWFR